MSRRRVAAGVIGLVGALSGPAAALHGGREAAPACGEARARRHGCEYAFTLAVEGFRSVFGSKGDGTLNYILPRLKVFDGEGLLVLDLTGYPMRFEKILKEAIRAPKRAPGGGTLREEFSRFRTAAAEAPPASGPGAADFNIVAYEAGWCVPCKKQLEEARKIVDASRKLGINLVRVEADVMKLDAEAQRTLLGFAVEPAGGDGKER
jgi:hypothetical protein